MVVPVKEANEPPLLLVAMAKVTVSLATGLLFVSTIVAVTLVLPFGRIVLGAAVTVAVAAAPATKLTFALFEKPLAVAVTVACPALAALVSNTSAMPLPSVLAAPTIDPKDVEKTTGTADAGLPAVSKTVARTNT